MALDKSHAYTLLRGNRTNCTVHQLHRLRDNINAPRNISFAGSTCQSDAERGGLIHWLLFADDFSIADIANWCWARTYKWSGVSIEGLTNLRRWLDTMKARPACRRGLDVPVKLKNLMHDEKAAKKFAENAQKTLQT